MLRYYMYVSELPALSSMSRLTANYLGRYLK
jgi:hypothetical protein